MRVAIVEDHAMMRDLLRRACERDFGAEVVFECSAAGEVLEGVARTNPNLAILDLQLPDADGLSLMADLRKHHPGLKILILSSRCDPCTVYRVERARADGFIDKGSQTVDMLGSALTALAVNRIWYSPAFARLRTERLRNPLSFDKLLTDREQTVLGMLGDCFGDREIAAKLEISPETAAKHRFNLLHKLDLRSTPELMRYARAQGFSSSAPLP